MTSVEPMFGTKNGGTPMSAEEKCGGFSPERLADWLIDYHGAKRESRETIISNIRSSYQTERAIGFIEGQAKAEVHISFSLFGSRKDK
jgi:hypothetical protein